jgi:bidirectional [NiFe] hydrogenase diaphorase subunit
LQKISLKINGHVIEVTEGMTVLEAARQEGIDIPTLCYLKALGPYGVCRLCLVEAQGPGLMPTILTSCNLKVSEGLVITTDSPVLQSTRRNIVELLLANTLLTEQLNVLAHQFGIDTSRFASPKSDPCILCGLCVRVCREKIRASALSFEGISGNDQVVAGRIRMDSEVCIGCGTCANICPVRAIELEDSSFERRIVLYGETASRFDLVRCEVCGTPYSTRKCIDFVISRLDDEQREGIRALCPECARHYYAEALTGRFPAEGREL